MGSPPSAAHTTPWPRPRQSRGLWPEARWSEGAAPQSRPCRTGTAAPELKHSDDPPHAPWFASATHGPSVYPQPQPSGIPADPFSRSPYQTALLYARYLSAEAKPGVADGLIRREFRAGTPYSGEDLLLSVPDGRAFAARCFKAAIAARMKAACLAAFRANGLDVQIRFAPGVLPHWRSLMESARRLVGA